MPLHHPDGDGETEDEDDGLLDAEETLERLPSSEAFGLGLLEE
jgi:hypothetical protein